MESVKIGIEVESDKYQNILRILRLLDIKYAYVNSISDNSSLVEFFIRKSDYNTMIRLKNIIEQFVKRYDTDFEYKIYYTDELNNLSNYFINKVNYVTSYNNTGIIFEPFSSISNDLYEDDESIHKYISRIYDKKYKYILPLKGNEFILSDYSYMNTFKLNLMVMDMIYSNNKPYNILILGENKGFYSEIFNDIYPCDLINIIDKKNQSEYADHILRKKYSIIFVSCNPTNQLIRDIIISGYRSSNFLVLGNIKNRDMKYYIKQISDNMNYKIFHSQNYCSIILSSKYIDNIDESIYDKKIKNGY